MFLVTGGNPRPPPLNDSPEYNNNIASVNVPPQNVKISLVGNLLRQEVFSYKTQSVNCKNIEVFGTTSYLVITGHLLKNVGTRWKLQNLRYVYPSS